MGVWDPGGAGVDANASFNLAPIPRLGTLPAAAPEMGGANHG